MEIVIGVILNENEVLINRRQKGQHLEGYWEFPGGKCEEGERAETALVRECFEETGLNVEILRELDRRNWTYPDRCLDLRFFECRPIGGQLQSEGDHHLRWVKVESLDAFTFPEANEAVLAYLQSLSA